MIYLVLAVLVAALGYGVWRLAAVAKRAEEDSAPMFRNRERKPYGDKFLSIFNGTER